MATDLTMLSGAPLARTWRRRRDRLARQLVHVLVFGPNPVPRWLLRALAGDRLSVLEDGFDRDFYLAQSPPGLPRRRAGRDPVLHFWLVGARQGRLPHPGFGGGHGVFPGAPSAEPTGKVVLFIDHPRGGGSSRLLAQHATRLAAEGWRVLSPRRVGQETPLFVFADAGGWRVFDLFADEAPLNEFARSQGVSRLVINHLIDLPPGAAAWLGRFAAGIGADYEVLLHDYYLACPRIDLIASDGRFCGLASVERCRTCLAGSGAALSGVDPVEWRAHSAALLAGAQRAIAPSADLAERLAAAFPEGRIDVEEPEDDAALPTPPAPPPLADDEPLRLLVLGALNRSKGLMVVIALARVLAARRANVRITLLGPSADPAALRRAGVRVMGRYQREDVMDLLAAARPHVIFFPAIWPETWSFTLTEALRGGAEILAFDIGAIAERLRRIGRGRLLAYGLHADPEALADAVLELRREISPLPT